VRLPAGSLADLRDPTAILEQLTRIQRAMIDDPALTVGSAKELIESTAKAVLLVRGRPVDEKAALPVLVKEAQQALGLHPSSASPGPDGNNAVRRILAVSPPSRSASASCASGARVGLHPRHAHLAVNAATTWCQLMLDTLIDPDAPWRRTT
jgi:hypothetical protein